MGLIEDDYDWWPIETTFACIFTAEFVLIFVCLAGTSKLWFPDNLLVLEVISLIPFYVEVGTGERQPGSLKQLIVLHLMKLFRFFQGEFASTKYYAIPYIAGNGLESLL